MAAEFTRRRITADLYERMVEAGIFTEDDRVELIGGEIVEMAALGARHVACVIRLDDLIRDVVRRELFVSVQNSVRLTDDTEPEPDVAVLRWRPDGTRLPTVADIVLLIEVADATRERDRAAKLPRYAAAGVAESWLIDLVEERIERYTDPGPERYGLVAPAVRGQSLVSTVLPALTLDVDTVLGYEQAEP